MKMTQQISRKSHILANTLIVFVSLCVTIMFFIKELVVNDNPTYSNYFKCFVFISILCPIIRISMVYFKLFVYYMFNTANNWWDKRVEKPRLMLYIVVFFLFMLIKVLLGFSPQSTVSLYILITITYLIGISILYYSWSKHFELAFIPTIEQELITLPYYLQNVKSIFYPTDYNIDNVVLHLESRLPKKAKLTCTKDEFINLICLQEDQKKKIVWKGDVKSLYRFIIIIFNIKLNTKNNIPSETVKAIRYIIENYFIDEKGDKVEIPLKITDLSSIKVEQELEEGSQSEYKILKDIFLKILKENKF